MSGRIALSLGLLLSAVNAAPGPVPTAAPVPASGPLASILNQAQLQSALSSLSSGPNSAFATGYTSVLLAISPTSTPTAGSQLASVASSAYSAYPSNPLAAGAEILLSGLAGSDFTTDLNAFGACNSVNNSNYVYAYPPVYPQKAAGDAPYDVSEANLRGAIYIPNTFQYGGGKTPLLFIPGTGVEACEDFTPNLAKLFANSSFADPVFVNVPTNMLQDEQTSAEFVAYAINYISRISHNVPVALITWSAGSIASQWALKYWPSTRNVVSDVINVSGDLHGTVLAPILCPPGVPCAPSVLQQYYNAKFIQTLRSNGGDSAYVPTTSIWSIFDEIVEPQQLPNASAMVNDARNVGVTNAQIQNICPIGTPAGGPNFGHESSLYNAVTYALAKDALTNPGPANIARSGAASMCNQFYAPGLTLSDVFASEFLIPLAGFNIEAYPNKVVTEPPIKPYAA